MSLWDVQRDTRDNRILAIRPAGFKGWGKKDGLLPLAIKQEELSANPADPAGFFALNSIACDKGGDGLSLSQTQIATKVQAEAIAADPEAISYLPDDKLIAEVQKRGLPVMIDEAIKEVR